MVLPPECYDCKHFQQPDDLAAPPKCAAFPNGIPRPIFFGELPKDADPDLTDQEVRVSHREPYPGDHGLQFEPADTAAAA